MGDLRLSICIPVYNFAAFIGATLASIISQATEQVEIIVVDGASSDNTTEIIQGYQKAFPRLRYHRLEKRGGIDNDMAKTVEMAQGGYCWLFGGDDIMMPGALANVLREIEGGYDVLLCESVLCGFDMTPIRKHNMLSINGDRIFELRNEKDRLEYFKSTRNTAAFFSFCSSLVIKKSRWDSVVPDETFIGSHWSHVARIFQMLPDGLQIKYLSNAHLYKRGENDSFLDKGLVNRYCITIDGYAKLAHTFFDYDSIEAFHIRRAIIAERNLKSLLDAKLISHERGLREDLVILDRLASTLYCDPIFSNRMKLLVYKFAPMFLLRIAKPVYGFIQAF